MLVSMVRTGLSTMRRTPTRAASIAPGVPATERRVLRQIRNAAALHQREQGQRLRRAQGGAEAERRHAVSAEAEAEIRPPQRARRERGERGVVHRRAAEVA